MIRSKPPLFKRYVSMTKRYSYSEHIMNLTHLLSKMGIKSATALSAETLVQRTESVSRHIDKRREEEDLLDDGEE